MNKLVWVMGESATGKETFIKYAVANPYCDFIQKLGFTEKIISVETSITHLNHSDERLKIEKLVLDLLDKETSATILIKWQWSDSIELRQSDVLLKLASIPNVSNEIIILSAEHDVLYDRLQNKFWWKDYGYSRELMETFIEKIRTHAQELILNFGFKMAGEIDVTNGYKLIGRSIFSSNI